MVSGPPATVILECSTHSEGDGLLDPERENLGAEIAASGTLECTTHVICHT